MRRTTMKRRDKGQVLVLVALAIFVLLGLAALGIDVGFMYSVRHELQRSADAGALAGVAPFTTRDWTDVSVRAEADALARDFATKNTVVKTQLNRLEPPNGEVHVYFPVNRIGHIGVDTSRNVDLFFARIFGIQNRTITAHAMAWAAPTNERAECIAPFAIPLLWIDADGDGLFDNNITSEYNSVTPFCSGDVVTNCWPTGTVRNIHIGQPRFDPQDLSSQETSGQFFIMDGNAGNEYPTGDVWNFAAGEGCMALDLSRNISLQPGGAMGPINHGMDLRIASGDDWSGEGPLPARTGNRLVYIVVYDPRVLMVDGGHGGPSGNHAAIPGNNPGSATPTVSFAGFYLEPYTGPHNNEWLRGRYAGIMLSGTGTNIGPTTGVAKHPELVE
jgi:hypothetical protein